MNQTKLHPIGMIYSPYKKRKDIPIHGRFKDDVEAWVELKDKYVKGLKDLDKIRY
jgi:tRNA (Thr-GGU) A37 N-methylase